jgi:hypothetical protein
VRPKHVLDSGLYPFCNHPLQPVCRLGHATVGLVDLRLVDDTRARATQQLVWLRLRSRGHEPHRSTRRGRGVTGKKKERKIYARCQACVKGTRAWLLLFELPGRGVTGRLLKSTALRQPVMSSNGRPRGPAFLTVTTRFISPSRPAHCWSSSSLSSAQAVHGRPTTRGQRDHGATATRQLGTRKLATRLHGPAQAKHRD